MSKNTNDSDFARVEALARERGLSEIERSTSYRAPALKIAGKAFVRLKEPGIIVLPCPIEQKTLLMEISPEVYFETDHYIGHEAVLVRLDRIDDEELSLRLHDAWHFKAPKRLKGS